MGSHEGGCLIDGEAAAFGIGGLVRRVPEDGAHGRLGVGQVSRSCRGAKWPGGTRASDAPMIRAASRARSGRPRASAWATVTI